MAHKKHDHDHVDPKIAEMDARLEKLAKRIRKADSKKERKAYQAEFDALDQKRTERMGKLQLKEHKADVAKLAAVTQVPESVVVPEEGDDDRKAYVAAKKLLTKAGHPGQPAPDDIDRTDPDLVAAYNLVVGRLTGHYITSDDEKAEMARRLKEDHAATKERVRKKRAARVEGGLTPLSPAAEAALEAHEATVTPITKAKGKKAVKGDVNIAEEATKAYAASTPEQDAADIKVATALADPAPEIPRDRWDRPLIVPVDGEKPVGYRRVTTFIDVIDDKTTLTTWGRRVVVAGIAAVEQKIAGDSDVAKVDEVGTESIITRVMAANSYLAEAVKKANKALAKGKVTESEHAAAHDAAEKAHKAALDELVQEAFKAGDGFVKAETGTRIHKLTELYDKGEKLPDDTTPSEFRDVEAYAAACKMLNVEILAVEQFVVIDEFKMAGTLDRRIRYDSPTLGRRITGIGDVKTGRVDYGAGKMTRQLAGYAMGKGYDFATGERQTFRTNREVGLIFHIPAGSGVCTVYEIDLKKGLEGLKLCAQVYAHRDETKTARVFTEVAKADHSKEA